MTFERTKYLDSNWQLRQPITPKFIGVLLLIALVLTVTGRDAEIGQGLRQCIQAVGAIVGIGDSPAIRGGKKLLGDSFPMVLREETEVIRLSNFNENKLPWLSFIEVKTTPTGKKSYCMLMITHRRLRP